MTKFDAVEAPKDDGETALATAAPDITGDAQAARARKLREQAETVRKLFLAMVADPRIVLLKLADRLHNMRTMAAQPPAKREQKSRETLEIYAPLAGRIGVHVFQTELEDLAFAFLIRRNTSARSSVYARKKRNGRTGPSACASVWCMSYSRAASRRRSTGASNVPTAPTWRCATPAWMSRRSTM